MSTKNIPVIALLTVLVAALVVTLGWTKSDHDEYYQKRNAALRAAGVKEISCPKGLSMKVALEQIAQTGKAPKNCAVVMMTTSQQ
jgi:hypothetical protein